MNKIKIGIFLSLALIAGLFSSCKEKRSNHRFVINEVLMENQTNFMDDYGVRSAWIELFNRSFGSANLAGYYIKCSANNGDTVTYRIPKGDVKTVIKPRQHALFWADGEPYHGTFHTNIRLNPQENTWIGLYDDGKNLIDQINIPANTLAADQSYARIQDGAADWEVKGADADHYVTPDTNNEIIEKNVKMEKFEKDDDLGIGMAITAMSVVFFGLILLYVFFRCIGKLSVNLSKKNEMKAKGITSQKEASDKHLGEVPGEVYAAIGMALHEMNNEVHDHEDMVLTINRVKRAYSPWSSKIYTLRQTPKR